MATPESGEGSAGVNNGSGAGRIRPHLPHSRGIAMFGGAFLLTLLVAGRYAGDIRSLLHPAKGYLVFGLDSLSFCDGSTHAGDLSAPYEATVLSAMPGWQAWSGSVPGQRLQQAIDGDFGDRALTKVMNRVPSNHPRWLVITGGSEDMISGQVSLHDAEWQMLQICSLAHDAGWKVAIQTLTPVGRTSPFLRIPYDQWEKTRRDFNAWLLTSSPKMADAVIDSAADPRLANPADPHYFSPDQFHLADGGYSVLGETAANVLLAVTTPGGPQPVASSTIISPASPAAGMVPSPAASPGPLGAQATR